MALLPVHAPHVAPAVAPHTPGISPPTHHPNTPTHEPPPVSTGSTNTAAEGSSIPLASARSAAAPQLSSVCIDTPAAAAASAATPSTGSARLSRLLGYPSSAVAAAVIARSMAAWLGRRKRWPWHLRQVKGWPAAAASSHCSGVTLAQTWCTQAPHWLHSSSSRPMSADQQTGHQISASISVLSSSSLFRLAWATRRASTSSGGSGCLAFFPLRRMPPGAPPSASSCSAAASPRL